MLISIWRITRPTVNLNKIPLSASIGTHCASPRIRPALRKCALQQRCYAQPASKPSRAEEALNRLDREANDKLKDKATSAKVLIYHAGTTRTTFLALVKLSTLFVGAFFIGIVTPSYVRSEKPLSTTASVALCGLVPPIFVAFVTAPFVTHIHLHPPAQARGTKAHFERWVRSSAFSPSTSISLTTMSFISRPRITTIQAGNLVPTKQRFGLVNYVRREGAELDEARKQRKWYMFRPVTSFYAQQGRPGQPRQVRYQDKKPDRTEWWIWEELKDKLAKRARLSNA